LLRNRQKRITPDALQCLKGIPGRRSTKFAGLLAALGRPKGATNVRLVLTAGWKPLLVRGAISGLLRERLGLNMVLTLEAAGERVYRIG
jgi:hypothetical protein